MWRHSNSMQSFPGRFSLAVIISVMIVAPVAADVCVWRDPERTMTKLFPEAADYTTLTFKVTADHVAAIEQSLGESLDPSETHEINFYTITDRTGARLGTVMALAGKGEYGAIEVVIGLDSGGRTTGVYIQQSRERLTAAIKAPTFLGQFVGKSASDSLTLGHDLVAAPAAERASAVVATTIRKMLLFYDAMLKGVSQ